MSLPLSIAVEIPDRHDVLTGLRRPRLWAAFASLLVVVSGAGLFIGRDLAATASETGTSRLDISSTPARAPKLKWTGSPTAQRRLASP